MDKIKLYALKSFFLIMRLMPMCIIVLLSIIFGKLIYIVGYRKKIVIGNINRCFPNKSDKEKKHIISKFYYNLVFQTFSFPKLLYLSPDEIKQKHFRVTNDEVIKKLKDSGHNVVFIMMGHYGNWELLSAGQLHLSKFGIQQEQIYRPQKDEIINHVIIEIRERNGSICLPKENTIRRISQAVRDKKNPTAFAFAADQSPSPANVHYFTNFLGQETAFLTGAERLARKYNIPVVYLDIIYLRDGEYLCDIHLLCEDPNSMPPMSITEAYAKAMEKTILRDPSHWLWSHNRWKISPDKFPDAVRSLDLQSDGNC